MHKKIKIVFVINNFLIGGVERLIFDIVSSLDKEKYDIKIVTVFGSGPMEDSFRKLNIPIYFAGLSDSLIKKFPADFSWVLTTFFITLRVILFFLKSKPDIVVTSLFQADIIGMISSKVVGVKKRILIQHDTVEFMPLIRRIKKNFALRISTEIVSISETVKNFLIEYFEVKKEKILTIFNGIDYEKFRKGEKNTSPFCSLVFGIVGRLEEIKGHIYALEAFSILRDKYRLSPEVLLAGDGSLRTGLKEYVSFNKLNNISFLGNISDVPDFLSKIDILIVPSISEGFGLVVLEGMVSKKVVIASDIKVMYELIKDGETGFLFKSQDANSLAEVLVKILKEKEIFNKVQKNTILFIEENKKIFNIKEVSETYQILFSK